MKVTTKGQVTIPLKIREKLGINTSTEVEFVEIDGKVYLQKKKSDAAARKYAGLRGRATVGMTTDEIMNLTRTE